MKINFLKFFFLVLISMSSVLFRNDAYGATAAEIDVKVNATLEIFKQQVPGAVTFIQSAKGLLVFPSVFKAGFIIGGEYGEGALRIDGKTVDYYSTAGGSFGLQIGAQSKSIVVAFMDAEALNKFQSSSGWKVGVDGSIAMIELGAGQALDSTTIKDPIVGFIFSNKGLMVNLTLEGSKFTKLNKAK